MCVLNNWFFDDERVEKLSYYEVLFYINVKLGLEEHLFEDVGKPLARYLMLFINPDGVREMEKIEQIERTRGLDGGYVIEGEKKKKVVSAKLTPDGKVKVGNDFIDIRDIFNQVTQLENGSRK